MGAMAGNEPLWPAVDPDGVGEPPPPRPRGIGYPVVALVLAAALAVLTGISAAGASRTVPGTALPVPTRSATSTTTPPAPTSTTPPIHRIYLLADHPLLAAGVTLPAVDCALPRFRRDTASLRAYYQALVDCMNRAWQPVLAAGMLPYSAPELNVDEHPGQTGCGNPDKDADLGDFTALYCPADHTLYLPVDRLKDVDRGIASSHVAVVAHEYGHHIQELSGLLWAAAEEIGKAGDGSPQANELIRRSELQANCFAGLFLAAAAGRGAITRNLADQAVAEFRNGALPETHGSATHQAAWARKGYQQRTTAACNTWAAPPSELS